MGLAESTGIEPVRRLRTGYGLASRPLAARAALLEWWSEVGTIHRPAPYEGDALPLSYRTAGKIIRGGNHRAGHRQKQQLRRQQRLNARPESHGHGSLRPSFSCNGLSPCTMRVPRLTRVSDGKPFRRLLVTSKPELVFLVLLHDGLREWFGPPGPGRTGMPCGHGF